MGIATYPDTNNQFAYRTNRDAFLQGIRERAQTLWMNGYRVHPAPEPSAFLVVKEGEPSE